MLPYTYRLLTPLPRRCQIYFPTPLFVLKAHPNNLAHSRFGFVVSKQIDKRATARNKAKRRLRSCIEELRLAIQPGFDILFILKSVTLPEEGLGESVRETLQKQKLLI